MKYAIRIVDGTTGQKKLFAIVRNENVERYRNMARNTIRYGSSDWVSVNEWSMDVSPQWWEFPAGNLFN